MENSTVLIVEDEDALRQMTRFALERENYRVIEAAEVEQARLALADHKVDLILLDWMLPGCTGLDYAREIRADERNRDVPIIMLTARSEDEDKVRGLFAGCDDYLTKPFSTAELLARLHALLRRSRPGGQDGPISVGGLQIDVAAQRVSAAEQPVSLGPTEYRLLYFFATHAERVFSRTQLLDRVWGQNVYVEERTVDVHIRRLRKALAPFGCDALIQTVRGSGYRFSTQPS